MITSTPIPLQLTAAMQNAILRALIGDKGPSVADLSTVNRIYEAIIVEGMRHTYTDADKRRDEWGRGMSNFVAKIEGNKAAFPMEIDEVGYMAQGLTKRELFAAMAMQGFGLGNKGMSDEHICALAVAMADALIAELAK